MNVRRLLPPDAIPSIDAPVLGEAYFGDAGDEVVVVAPERGPARAYPLRLLHYHEVINDVVGGVSDVVEGAPDDGEAESGSELEEASDDRPIAVTWCPICASAVVYDRTVDGDVLEFGVSGKLAADDLVLYDRRSGSEWKQSSGAAISGVHEGATLDVLPAGMMTYRRFEATHPDGLVLDPAASDTDVPDAEAARRYYDPEPYDDYFERDGFGYAAIEGFGTREWDREDLPAKAPVLGLGEGEEAIGVPYPVVREAGGVVELHVAGRRVVVVATDEAFHAFEVPDDGGAPGFDLAAAEGVEGPEAVRLVGGGTTWDPATGEGEDGRRLDRVPSRRLFAFAWQDDHGPGSFYGL